MTIDLPQFKVQAPDGSRVTDAGQATAYLESALAQIRDEQRGFSWLGLQGGAGWALVQLFGRLLELVIHRLDQVPEKHFLAFLNEAGIDLLAPRAAAAELTFFPADDGPAYIKVPAGTQVATIQTEFAPEVIFETRRDLVVVPNRLEKCIVIDPIAISDRSQQAAGTSTAAATTAAAPAFAAFKGDQERQRILYLGDADLFGFSDAASRSNATVSLDVALKTPADPIDDGWHLDWYTWDGKKLISLPQNAVNDQTRNFSQDGAVILTHLPSWSEAELDGQSSIWLAAKLTGGSARAHLPVVRRIQGRRTVTIADDDDQTGSVDAAFSAVQANTAFVPLDLKVDFFPLGQLPGRLDTFYLRSDEVFSKSGAQVQLNVTGLTGVPTDAFPSDPDADLSKLTLSWEYHGSPGWTVMGTSTPTVATEFNNSGFDDTTLAFTSSSVEGQERYIEFNVPSDPVKTTINDQEGHWIRCRLIAGGYTVPAKVSDISCEETLDFTFTPFQNHAPFMQQLQISYNSYTATIAPRDIVHCRSHVDGSFQTHRDGAKPEAAFNPQGFSPFQAVDEGPSLYLGFKQAFAAGQWIRLLLDVKEEQTVSKDMPPVVWQYWNGKAWTILKVADGSKGLRERGYLGFFGPDDHQAHTAFGVAAHWLRTRPIPPQADAGDDQSIEVEGTEASVTLDGSGSQSFDPQRSIVRYHWYLKQSNPPRAEAGEPQTVTVPVTVSEAEVTLDASASAAAPGRPIQRYIWKLLDSDDEEDQRPTALPYLKGIRINTVAAVNTVTLTNEVLGASSGKPNQSFYVARTPVYQEVQIAVREPDRPPEDELAILKAELATVDPKLESPILPADAAAETGVWVRWHQVSDFHHSGPASRHFTLDPITGRIQFGDGLQGKIPLAGGDNIKALRYAVHDGAAGNTGAGTITVMRNPSGDLAEIKSVTNPEVCAGGSDAETVAQVKRRGPQRLKSRDRAVTLEDFEALAREASGEVAHARCLPTRDPNGARLEGWVTVVVMPQSSEARPTPGPVLVRTVKQYLEDRALTNLADGHQIYVKGPAYIEASINAQVVPLEPEKADEVELDILEALENFLHPLRGGPLKEGWALGRNVFLSEVYAEIEAVSGVDHVARLRMQGSIQQYRIDFAPEPLAPPNEATTDYRRLPFDVPAESQVSTFDNRIKLVLAEPVVTTEDQSGARTVKLDQIDIYGFKVGDRLSIVTATKQTVKDNLIISDLDRQRIYFSQPFDPPVDWDQRWALQSQDQRIRLPLDSQAPITNKAGRISGLSFDMFTDQDTLSIVIGGKRHPQLEFLPIHQVSVTQDRINIPEGHLTYSGHHDIDMVLGG